MLSLILSSLIITSEPNYPTEIIGSAQTISGKPKTLSITQPENYIQTLSAPQPQFSNSSSIPQTNQPTTKCTPPEKARLIINDNSIIFPKNLNPLNYENKIQNTIYQLGDRLIIIQSIPIKYIKKALTPNIQPTITNYPIL